MNLIDEWGEVFEELRSPLGKARIGQRGCHSKCVLNNEKLKPRNAFVLPCRYGKSDIMRLTASEIFLRWGRPTLALCPWAILRDQLVNPKKVLDMAQRYRLPFEINGLPIQDAFRPIKNVSFDVLQVKHTNPFINGEVLIASTIGLVNENLDDFKALADHYRNLQKPLRVVIDECHFFSEKNTWGGIVDSLIEYGATVDLFTATAVRKDNELIPGFDWEDLGQSKQVASCEKVDRGDKWEIIPKTIDKELRRLVADYEYTNGMAWRENPSPLCMLDRKKMDMRLSEVLDEDDHRMLSDLSESEARRHLRKFCENILVIDRCVRQFLEELAKVRGVAPEAVGIIFTGTDREGSSDNKHANEIKKRLEELWSEYLPGEPKCVIATQKSMSRADGSNLAIQNFCDDDIRDGDVLLVKNMGGAGLDSWRMKVLLDLSSVRTQAANEQRWFRVATPNYERGLCVGRVIMLADKMSEDCWQRVVAAEGGDKELARPGDWVTVGVEIGQSYLVDKKDHDEKCFIVESVELDMFDDNDGNRAMAEDMPIVREFTKIFPTIVGQMSDAQITSGVDQLSALIRDKLQGGVRCPKVGDSIHEWRAQCNIHAEAYANTSRINGVYDQSRYAEFFKEIWNYAKTEARVGLSIQAKDIQSIDTLKQIARAMVKFLHARGHYSEVP